MSLLRFLLPAALVAILAVPAVARAQVTETPQADAGPLVTKSAPAKTLNNTSVIRMAQANLSDDLIIQAINTQPGQYTTDADAMIALKEAGVSERVITAMINRGRRRLTPGGEATDDPPPAPVTVIPVNEIGVYYKDRKGIWQPIEAEVIHAKSGGWLKSTATHGIIKTDMNGRVNGAQSKLALQAPIEFMVYTPDGAAAADYTLVRFRLHPDYREFRTLTGGVFHSTGGADRDEVKFNATRIAARTYTFTIDHAVGGGEYGILPPGTANIANGGKIYTFAITE
ncbi:MAG: hypothetical protein PW789_13855 [Edaphobacter sp.]|uniref:hypothetical protein n=1 Tax=Edaphobacter sp. TaxID=1934404 RepID=UPI00238F0E39|nr:hypothetical protein [Edaphobacter sp.]MDE1177666.1 hypothetical protein [Edaphobacter sp.]